MKCKCGYENPPRQKKCAECGELLRPAAKDSTGQTPPPPREKTTGTSHTKSDPTPVVSPPGAEKKAPQPAAKPPKRPPKAGATVFESPQYQPPPVYTPRDNLACTAPGCLYHNRNGMDFCYLCGTPLHAMEELERWKIPEPKPFKKEPTEKKEPRRVRGAKLVLRDGSEILIAGAHQLIGREHLKRTVPADRELWVSRSHFWIYSVDGRYYIEDRESKNDTSVNGRNIRGTGRVELHDGDYIEISPTYEGSATDCTFHIDSY